MPTRITRTRTHSRRTIFGGRVTTRVTTSQSSPRITHVNLPLTPVTTVTSGPQAQVHLTGAQMVELQRLYNERLSAARAQDSAQQQAHMEAMIHAPRGFSMLSAARWLHTVLGVVTTFGAFALAAILAFAFDWPWAMLGVTVLLAIADWFNIRTLHGAIGWRQLAVARRGLRLFVAFLLIAFGWLFLPAVYAIQAWRLAPEVAARVQTIQRQQIAALEAEVLEHQEAPPPPIVPLAD